MAHVHIYLTVDMGYDSTDVSVVGRGSAATQPCNKVQKNNNSSLGL